MITRRANNALRKVAVDWDAIGRHALFGGGGAGLGLATNALLGNKSLLSYLLSGGIGAGAGLGAEALINKLQDKGEVPAAAAAAVADAQAKEDGSSIFTPGPITYGTAAVAVPAAGILSHLDARDAQNEAQWKAEHDAWQKARTDRFENRAKIKEYAKQLGATDFVKSKYRRRFGVKEVPQQVLEDLAEHIARNKPAGAWPIGDSFTPQQINDIKWWNPPPQLKKEIYATQAAKVPYKLRLKNVLRGSAFPALLMLLGYGADVARNAYTNRDVGL